MNAISTNVKRTATEAPPHPAPRHALVATGLVLGPIFVVASAMLGLGHEPDSMRAIFDDLGSRAGSVLLQDTLELIGFTIVLASFAGAAMGIRGRGATLGIVGAVLAMFGIAGFGLAGGTSLSVLALAQLPDHDAAFETAVAITQSGPLATVSTAGWILEIIGQAGILLVLLGLWRAKVIPVWPALICIVGVLLVATFGTITVTLIADVLLLVVGVWVALRLLRV